MIWPSLGIYFDIDRLGATDRERMFYGLQARRIFMKHFAPRAVGRSYLWQGDANCSHDGAERRFCIAVTAKDAATLATLRNVFARAGDRGLTDPPERFSDHPVDLEFGAGSPKPLRREPLPLWLWLDADGTVVVPGGEAEDIALCAEFNWAHRAN